MKKTARYFEAIYAQYNKRALCAPDPLQFLYDYASPQDREITALAGACFAYGSVKQILKTLDAVFTPLKNNPRGFVLTATAARLHRLYAGFKYRFTTEEELCAFWLSVKRIIQKYGSLEECFLVYDNPREETVLPALRAFARELRCGGKIKTLVPDPDKSSALKRMNLFLRWMVRQDEVDPGGWTRVSPARLIVPVDVHMHRIALHLGLTKRQCADMTTALEITRAFKKFSLHDPVKYDFSLTRFGIRDDMDYSQL